VAISIYEFDSKETRHGAWTYQLDMEQIGVKAIGAGRPDCKFQIRSSQRNIFAETLTQGGASGPEHRIAAEPSRTDPEITTINWKEMNRSKPDSVFLDLFSAA
jgi:hypothetical protein